MPLRWKTSGLLGSRRAHAATNRQSAANRALISRLLGVHRPFIGCEGARQRCTHVAAPFPDPFLLGDVTVTYDHVQPRLARRPPRARLRGGAVHQAEGRRGARGGGAGRVRAPAGRLRRLRQRGDELIPDRYVRRGLASWYGDAFDAKPTASGEAFDSTQFTTAPRQQGSLLASSWRPRGRCPVAPARSEAEAAANAHIVVGDVSQDVVEIPTGLTPRAQVRQPLRLITASPVIPIGFPPLV